MDIALTIAGYDNSGGAGVVADLRTFRYFGLYGVSVITALAVQNTFKVYEVFPVPIKTFREELRAVFEDFEIKGIKIGMLANEEIALETYRFLKNMDIPIVLDPVLGSTSGTPLLTEEGVRVLKEKILKIIYLVTPNIPEAERLCEEKIEKLEEVYRCAKRINLLGAKNVLIKGGHLEGEEAVDILYDGKDFYRFASKKIKGKSPRGTGCVYSSAILSNLVKGKNLIEAVKISKEFITEAIKESKKLGKGGEIMLF
ncbi:bifunctional hydroxymethylpyrimidine kinase/phosphomethylpyrimidine kinase [Aquifex pyrophilus]